MSDYSFKGIVKNLLNLFEILLFPSRCHVCLNFLSNWEDRIICNNCWEKLTPINNPVCLRCGKIFKSLIPSHFCQECLVNPPYFKVHRSYGEYRDTLRDLILLFKYKKKKNLGEKLANFSHQVIKKNNDLKNPDLIIPVPLHKIRLKERGFNQSEILAKKLATLMKKNFRNDILIKIRNTLPQSQLGLKERKKNVKNSFLVKNKERIKNKKILLIDDVYTTGSTINECARILIRGGAKEVCALTLAQAI